MTILATTAAHVLRHAPSEGTSKTIIPGVNLVRANGPTLVQRGILAPSACVVVQGNKISHAGENTPMRYGAGDYLASCIDMPLAGQVLTATRAKPFLSVMVELEPHEILAVVRDAGISIDATGARAPATFVGKSDERLLDVVLRLILSLDSERDARFLAPSLRRELVYRLVTGPTAHAMIQSALLTRADDGVGRAVEWIKTRFKEPLDIPSLAKRVNMSTSSFHHKFKATVMMGPLQYQKRLRLEEARRLLISGRKDATGAAFDVGYESPSQFTREYRRQFGLPPLKDVKRMREELRAA